LDDTTGIGKRKFKIKAFLRRKNCNGTDIKAPIHLPEQRRSRTLTLAPWYAEPADGPQLHQLTGFIAPVSEHPGATVSKEP
jgi:hypothetical protein